MRRSVDSSHRKTKGLPKLQALRLAEGRQEITTKPKNESTKHIV
jgi:hypothetical protein